MHIGFLALFGITKEINTQSLGNRTRISRILQEGYFSGCGLLCNIKSEITMNGLDFVPMMFNTKFEQGGNVTVMSGQVSSKMT